MTTIVPTVTEPLTVPVIVGPMTLPRVAALARELAIGLRNLDDILVAHSLSQADYEKLNRNEAFTKAVDMAKTEWNSASNTATRLAVEAAFTAEQLLPHVYARVLHDKEPLNHVVEFLKWLADVGGLKKDPAKGQSGERFQITINLGADTKIEFDGSRAPITGDPALAALPLPQFDDREERT